MNWVQIDIDLALIITFGLLVFAGLQWYAVDVQNNQNLFKMRIEHYKSFYELCNDILIRLKHYAPVNPETDLGMMELEEYAFELDNYIDESKFLFNQQLFESEFEFTRSVKEVFKRLYKSEVIPLNDIEELIQKFSKSKELIEGYLSKNRI